MAQYMAHSNGKSSLTDSVRRNLHDWTGRRTPDIAEIHGQPLESNDMFVFNKAQVKFA